MQRQLVAVALVLMICAPARAGTIHVPDDQPTIQAGINAASAGDTVLVSCGTYYEHDVIMQNGVQLLGVGPDAQCVVIDAQELGRVMYCDGLDSGTSIRNLTITGGAVTGAPPEGTGGGIHCEGGAPVFENVLLLGNTANLGGGMICKASNPQFLAVTFDSNAADYGGGIRISESSNAVFTNCIFVSNTAAFKGGGMYSSTSRPHVVNTTFYGNSATEGGSAAHSNNYQTTFDNCLVASNDAPTPVSCGDWGTALLRCCDVWGNTGGDWVGCIAGQDSISGNFSADPMFCDAAAGDYSVDASSPCLPPNNSCGELIGALGQGCWTPEAIYVSPDGTGDVPTLQAGIDSCLAGGTVIARSGVFSGDGNQNLDFHGKPISVISEYGAASTQMDCQGSGRGVLFQSGEDSLSVLRGFTISGAVADTGAGILCDGSSPRIENCIIELCAAASGAGVACLGGSAPQIVGTALAQNMAGLGAGLHCRSGSSPRFTDSSVTGNWAFEGGGIWVSESAPVFTDALIDSNTATNGGGVFCTVNGNITLERCSVVGNTASGNGGGMFCTSSSPLCENVTFFANSTDGVGAGIHSQDSSPILRGALVAFNLGGSGIECAGAPQPLLEYSDVFGNAGGDSLCGLDLGGNISEDPLFCDIWDGDLTLCANSPCLVAGAPSGWIGRHGEGCPDCGGTGIDEAPDSGDSPTHSWVIATPNPFTGQTSIRYGLPRSSGWVRLAVYEVSGREVRTLVNESTQSAFGAVTWDGRGDDGQAVASGVYFYRLEADGSQVAKKILLLK